MYSERFDLLNFNEVGHVSGDESRDKRHQSSTSGNSKVILSYRFVTKRGAKLTSPGLVSYSHTAHKDVLRASWGPFSQNK
jgi:hypothetical protein